MSNKSASGKQGRPVDEASGQHATLSDVLPQNIEQIRKIQVLEKEIEFW